jgi:hypothetical protein
VGPDQFDRLPAVDKEVHPAGQCNRNRRTFSRRREAAETWSARTSEADEHVPELFDVLERLFVRGPIVPRPRLSMQSCGGVTETGGVDRAGWNERSRAAEIAGCL